MVAEVSDADLTRTISSIFPGGSLQVRRIRRSADGGYHIEADGDRITIDRADGTPGITMDGVRLNITRTAAGIWNIGIQSGRPLQEDGAEHVLGVGDTPLHMQATFDPRVSSPLNIRYYHRSAEVTPPRTVPSEEEEGLGVAIMGAVAGSLLDLQDQRAREAAERAAGRFGAGSETQRDDTERGGNLPEQDEQSGEIHRGSTRIHEAAAKKSGQVAAAKTFVPPPA